MTKGLPYFYVPEAASRVPLSPEDGAHAMKSLRLRPGDEVTVSDGQGWVARGKLTLDGPVRSVVDVMDEERFEAPERRVRVALAAPSGDRAWWAIQKLTELGVDAISIVESARSVRKQLGREVHVLRRALVVAREAAKQSRRPFLPDVDVPAGGLFSDAPDDERALVLYEGGAQPMLVALTGTARTGETISVYVGPEGGLAEEEVEEAKERGAALVSLGSANLRSETAAFAGAALVLSQLGRLG
jgi:16S rRNA (uracil1498-N3)-methyltransferase